MHAPSDDAGAALELVGVSKLYRVGTDEVRALDGVNLQVHRGEVVALAGPSGSGKSTLLHVAGGLEAPDAGTVLCAGTDLATLKAGGRARLRRRAVGFVFQFFQLLPGLTVEENVELPLALDGDRAARTAARAMLARVGLSSRAARYPGELSGGEMQRVAVARALVARAPLILADEPTGNLDSQTGKVVLDLLTAEARDAGAALLLATHDASAASRADRLLSLHDGQLSEGPHGGLSEGSHGGSRDGLSGHRSAFS